MKDAFDYFSEGAESQLERFGKLLPIVAPVVALGCLAAAVIVLSMCQP